jgi:predicted transglutaminase-like protease
MEVLLCVSFFVVVVGAGIEVKLCELFCCWHLSFDFAIIVGVLFGIFVGVVIVIIVIVGIGVEVLL